MSAVKNLSIRLAAVGGDKVRKEFKSLGADGERAFRQITNVITPANDNLKALDVTARTFNDVIRKGTALFGAYLGFQGLKNTFSAIFSANKSFEQLSGSLKTVTGSAQGAQQAFALIEKFAIDTPYQLNEIVEAFIRLKALGLDSSEAALTSYGNTASAFGKNIKDFVDAVAAATVGEFERLKTFGIKARAENEKVSFTFQGVTTTVQKNATEIEKYLRSLGDINFAGAMSEQMKTMNGVLSNIEDSFEKIYRQIGQAGLNEVLKSTFTRFNELVESGGTLADTIGKTLATAVSLASNSFFLLAEHADVALTLLATRFSSTAILGGIKLLKGGVEYLQASLVKLSLSTKSAITGIAMMSQVSKVAAVQMGVLATATGLLKGALALVGGPAGLAVLTGIAIYKLVDSHDVAKKAAKDHAETLKELQNELKATTEEASKFAKEQTKDMALAEWGLKLKTAEQNVKDLRRELKNTGGLSFMTRFTPNAMLKDYEIYAKDWAEILKQSKIDLAQYEKEIWKIAAEYPDFQPQAQEIQNKLLLLKAAEKDAWTARQELKYLENPELRPKIETETEVKTTVTPVSKEQEEKYIGAYFNKTSRWLNRYIKNGVFVAGNHIVYNESKHSLQYFLHQYEKHYPLDANLSFLNNRYKVIDDVVFVGGTLWTDYKVIDKNNPDLYMWYATKSLNDYRFGKVNTSLCIEKEQPEDLRHLRPEDCVEMFKETLSTIDKVCALFPNKKIVVVTHHAPSAKSVPLMYLNSESTPCYASSLEDFILDRPNIKLWCHGHIHTFCDYNIGDCRIICNPRGYAKYHENSGFKKDFIIDI